MVYTVLKKIEHAIESFSLATAKYHIARKSMYHGHPNTTACIVRGVQKPQRHHRRLKCRSRLRMFLKRTPLVLRPFSYDIFAISQEAKSMYNSMPILIMVRLGSPLRLSKSVEEWHLTFPSQLSRTRYQSTYHSTRSRKLKF